MFINNINPILFSLGPFSVRYYGIIYVIGFLITYFFLKYTIKKGRLKLTHDQLDKYFIWLIVGVIVGARFFEVFIYNVAYYIHHLNEIFSIWNGGMSFHGGLVGAAVITWIYCRKYKINVYDLLDLMVIPAAFSLFLGRLANFTNSEIYGTITTPEKTPWCVIFQKVDNYCRHPYQIYESLANLASFFVLLPSYIHQQSTKKFRKGILFWLFILMYGVYRFLLSFVRDEPLYYGLDIGQYLCVVMIILGVIYLWKIQKGPMHTQ